MKFLLKEKQEIRRGMTRRATMTRAREIIKEKHGVDLSRKTMRDWLVNDSWTHTYGIEMAAAFLQAIAERNEKVELLVKPQRERAVASAKRLVEGQ